MPAEHSFYCWWFWPSCGLGKHPRLLGSRNAMHCTARRYEGPTRKWTAAPAASVLALLALTFRAVSSCVVLLLRLVPYPPQTDKEKVRTPISCKGDMGGRLRQCPRVCESTFRYHGTRNNNSVLIGSSTFAALNQRRFIAQLLSPRWLSM